MLAQDSLDATYKSHYDGEAAVYDDARFGSRTGAFSKRYKNEVILHALRAHNCLDSQKRILDVPSGTGRIANAILSAGDCLVEAVDISTEMLLRNAAAVFPEHRHRIRFRHANIRELPYADSVFDAVTVGSFLYLVPESDYPAYLKDVARVLKPGGVLLVEVSNALAMYSPKAFASIMLHRLWQRKLVKSYTYFWRLRRLFAPLLIVAIAGTEFPSIGSNYSRYRVTSIVLGRTTPLKLFSGKFTVVLQKPCT